MGDMGQIFFKKELWPKSIRRQKPEKSPNPHIGNWVPVFDFVCLAVLAIARSPMSSSLFANPFGTSGFCFPSNVLSSGCKA